MVTCDPNLLLARGYDVRNELASTGPDERCLQHGRGRHGHDGRRKMAATVTADET